jgi:hypothetical protein
LQFKDAGGTTLAFDPATQLLRTYGYLGYSPAAGQMTEPGIRVFDGSPLRARELQP